MAKINTKFIIGTMIVNADRYAESAALLDYSLKKGLNAFDIAHVYGGGNTERAMGRWMKERGNRNEVFVVTKGAHHNADRARVTPWDITSDLMDSLARLQTDYIDSYLLHRDDESVPVGPIVEILNEHYGAGRIREFGGSNWTHLRIAEANAYAKSKGLKQMTVSSPNYGLCEQVDNPWGPGCVSIGGDAGLEARRYYAENKIGVYAYSSLGRGMLSGRVDRENYKGLLDGASLAAYAYEVNFARVDRARELAAQKGVSVPQIGIAYILNQKFPVYPIVGAASERELDETLEAAAIALSADELTFLENR